MPVIKGPTPEILKRPEIVVDADPGEIAARSGRIRLPSGFRELADREEMLVRKDARRGQYRGDRVQGREACRGRRAAAAPRNYHAIPNGLA